MVNVDAGGAPPPAPPPSPGDGASTGTESTTHKEERENRRSAVRMVVTYVAAGFLFVVGAAMIGYFVSVEETIDDAKDIFLAILPIASAVITYWFASRQSGTGGGG